MSLASLFRVIGPRTPRGDHLYSWLRFRQKHGRSPRWGSEGSYSDHLYRLKVDGSLLDPLRQFVSDKQYVKQYICGTVGPQFAVRTLRILTTASEVDRLTLPRIPCVVKPTHLSGRVTIHTSHDQEPDRERLKKWLGINYYLKQREQNYRFLRPKIIIEEFFSPDGLTVPCDYKVFCFFGKPRFIQVDLDRFGSHLRNFYDTGWRRLRVSCKRPGGEHSDPEPPALTEMLDIAAKLSQPFPFIRVDMYAIGDEVKVGELTNCPESANSPFRPSTADDTIGKMFRRNETVSLASFY